MNLHHRGQSDSRQKVFATSVNTELIFFAAIITFFNLIYSYISFRKPGDFLLEIGMSKNRTHVPSFTRLDRYYGLHFGTGDLSLVYIT